MPDRAVILIVAAMLLSACASTKPGPHQAPREGPPPTAEFIELPNQTVEEQLSELGRFRELFAVLEVESNVLILLGRPL